MEDERIYLTLIEAEAMLADDEYIHTFRNTAGILIGADWKRSQLVEAFKKYKPELSGETATNMKHGLVFIDEKGPLFIETAHGYKKEE